MTIYFAHRGSLTEAPENTLPSFQRAFEKGAKAIELDVQLTKDGQLVICHDQVIDRVAGGHQGFIKDFTLERLREIDLGSSFSEAFKGVSFATLPDVLDICPAGLLINVEIKNIPFFYRGIEEKLMACLQSHGRMDDTIVSSFDHLALKRVREIAPDVKIGMLFQDQMLAPWRYAEESGLGIYSVHPAYVFVDQDYVANSHNARLKVFPWTVDSPEDLQRLLNDGVDGAFTNNPEIFG